MIASISWETLDIVGFETVKILLSLLWQSSILLAAVGLLTYGLRHRRASLRHQLWVASDFDNTGAAAAKLDCLPGGNTTSADSAGPGLCHTASTG